MVLDEMGSVLVHCNCEVVSVWLWVQLIHNPDLEKDQWITPILARSALKLNFYERRVTANRSIKSCELCRRFGILVGWQMRVESDQSRNKPWDFIIVIFSTICVVVKCNSLTGWVALRSVCYATVYYLCVLTSLSVTKCLMSNNTDNDS